MNTNTFSNRAAGYTYLIQQYHLNVSLNWHTSSIGKTGSVRSVIQDGQEETIYPMSYWPGDSSGDHLEFALKYDGINLEILSAAFEAIPENEITAWITAKPTGKNTRRIWFLFEFLCGKELSLPNQTTGNYIDLLETERYFALSPGRRSPRHRVMNNLPGERLFCPIIRRTEKLAAIDRINLRQRCENLLQAYPQELLRRALSYLYIKETKSSFQIEQITPSASRAEKFISLLELAAYKDFCTKPFLIDLQNRIVDSRFRDTDYRQNQNYVGQTISLDKQLIHYVSPKPEDLDRLMDGLLTSHRIMKEGAIPAIVHAAVISYGFVFLHPFSDGNGRIHRFLIHNILSIRGAVPQGMMFPVSAAMIKNPALYDHSLEAFSKPLLQKIDYSLDDLGQMTVTGETSRWYQYMDMTAQAEALLDFVTLAAEQELVEELGFLTQYDKTRQNILKIADMPDQKIDLLIHLCLQNSGHLSARKRETYFSFLTDDEVTAMEDAVREGYA